MKQLQAKTEHGASRPFTIRINLSYHTWDGCIELVSNSYFYVAIVLSNSVGSLVCR